MTGQAWAFAAAAVALSLISWPASWRGWSVMVLVARPASTAALVGMLLWLPGVDATVAAVLVVGLGCAAVGDVALAMPGHRWVAGAAALFVARGVYSAALVVIGVELGGALLVLIVAAFTMMTVGRVILVQVHRLRPALLTGAVAFMSVSACSVALGVATGQPLIGLGVVTLALGDVLLGWNWFVRSLAGGHGVIHVVSHAGQLMVVTAMAPL